MKPKKAGKALKKAKKLGKKQTLRGTSLHRASLQRATGGGPSPIPIPYPN
jgi:hypothetical protein